MKRTINFPTRRTCRLTLLLGTAGLGGCSLINSLEPVDETPPSVGDGDGDGDGMGGASGGSSNGDGDGDGDGTGGGPDVTAEPGLVLVIGTDGSLTPTHQFVALSPQTGEELFREEAKYETMAYEPERDLWFLIRANEDPLGDDTLVIGRFDRVTNTWTYLNEAAADLPVFEWEPVFFALSERLVLRDLEQNLHVLNTSDPLNVTEVDELTLPPGTLWDAAPSSATVGGDVNFFSWCNAVTCGTDQITLTRMQVSAGAVAMLTPTPIRDFTNGDNAHSQGSLVLDSNFDRLVLVIPEDAAVSGPGTGVVALYNRQAHTAIVPPGDILFPQQSGKLRQSAFDPCQSVIYMAGLQSSEIRGIATDADDGSPLLPVVDDLGTNGASLVYEPYTQSLLVVNSSFDNFGIDAWRTEGTKNVPDLKKRGTVEWNPPSNVRPSFVAVETSLTAVCN